ncbi:protein PEAK3 [Corvus hawaiiensis]|uniref:protein PEAK3 n=1 Tax=Corvus hawaiiensis TaxID=134902 RepID=UPI0020199BA6|nr:protein PEAK3 [Corvus hawaiiensis]
MASTGRGWDGQRELLRSRDAELEPRGTPPLPGTAHRASSALRSASLDLAAPAPATPMPDTPGGCPPRPPSSALIYSNLGELRAHLIPHKASRGEGAGRPLLQPDPDPPPPPLPKKQLQRAESLPEPGSSHRYHGDPEPRAGSILYSIPPPHLRREEGAPPRDRPSWGPKKPLTKSQSLGEPLAWSSPQKAPSASLKELSFGTADGELGQLLESPAGVLGVILGCQEAALTRLSARMQEELVGPEERQQLLEAELVGKRWAALGVLEPRPCCQSGDAWYFRVGFTFEHRQLQLAAKVPKPCCSSLGVQSSLGTHCSIQRLLGRFTDRLPRELVLPGIPGKQSQGPSGAAPACPASRPVLQVLLCAEVPQQTLADFVKSSHTLHRTRPGHYERLGCLLLLQLCMGLEHLQGQNVAQGDLCPENLLLVQCPCPPQSQQGQKEPLGLSLPRLLISSFFKVQEKQRPCSSSQEQDWTQGLTAPSPPAAAELNVGRLIYQILHVDISLENILGFRSKMLPEIPSLSIYSAGLKRLATLLLHRDPHQRVSIEQARGILQVLLWGPRQELFARSRKSLELLRSWLEVKRALLLLRFAENSPGARASPSLEEWLCCQYFQGVTEHTLHQVTQVLYAP